MKLHPLGLRILRSVGVGAMACPALVACEPVPSAPSRCDGNSSQEVEPVPGCIVTVTSGEKIVEFCTSVALTEGACPAFDHPLVVTSLEANTLEVVCGPLGPPSFAHGQGGGDPVGDVGAGGSAGGGPGGDANGLFPTVGTCCYKAIDEVVCEDVGGRPFYVGGSSRVAEVLARSDWASPGSACVDSLDPAARRALSAAWRKDAALEHASVASFARFSLELLAVGAPPELLIDAHCAMNDEVQHARACFGLASRYAGEDLGPGPLAVGDAAPETSLIEVVRSTVREGCIGETIAAMAAARALSTATDPAVRSVLAQIAEDEARHAELAWRFVAWAVGRGGQPIVDVVATTIDAARPPAVEADPALDSNMMHAHGRLSRAEARDVVIEALDDVIRPCSRLLGWSPPVPTLPIDSCSTTLASRPVCSSGYRCFST